MFSGEIKRSSSMFISKTKRPVPPKVAEGAKKGTKARNYAQVL